MVLLMCFCVLFEVASCMKKNVIPVFYPERWGEMVDSMTSLVARLVEE